MSTVVERPHLPAHQAPARRHDLLGNRWAASAVPPPRPHRAAPVGAAAVGAAVHGVRRQHRGGVPDRRGPRVAGRVDHGQPGTTGALRPGLQRQHRRRGDLEGRDVPRPDRGGGDPHGDPTHPRRRGDRALRAHRLHRRRALRKPDRGTAARRRRVGADRGDRHRGSAHPEHSGGRVAGFRCRACLFGSGVRGGGRGRGSVVPERTVLARRRVRRARGGVHAARRRRCGAACGVSHLAVAAGVVAAGAALRRRQVLGAGAAPRAHRGPGRGRLPAAGTTRRRRGTARRTSRARRVPGPTCVAS